MKFEDLSNSLIEMKEIFRKSKGRNPRTIKELEEFLRSLKEKPEAGKPETRHLKSLKSLKWLGI